MRAFAAGFGTVCGLMAGAFLVGIFYGIAAGGISLFSSISGGSVPQAYPAAYSSSTVAPPTPYAECAPAPACVSYSSPYATPAPANMAENVQYYPVSPATFATPNAPANEDGTPSETDAEDESKESETSDDEPNEDTSSEEDS